MISLQTNTNSLVAQQNLSVNSAFQAKTIQQLTSGYRINSSGDDAAGLAVANKFRNSIAELSQGVANGNDAVAQLQIMDGGMNNISQMLDRLKTLAMQSSSSTFSGGDAGRVQLNAEFQNDIKEIDRQAQSIGLNGGGTFAKSLQVYLGAGSGSQSASNAVVSVDLSKATVDTQSLGLKGVQAANTATYSLGSSSATSVHAILNDDVNANSASAVTSSQFKLFGAGFSNTDGATDNAGITLTVNMNGVGDTNSLVSAINSAIQAEAQKSTGQASAFKAANVQASITTDASGNQKLAFSSASSSFEVQATDRTSNALLGNFDGTSTTGAVMGNVITARNAMIAPVGGGTVAGAGINLSGASTNAITLTFTGGTHGTQSVVLNKNYSDTASFTNEAAVATDINSALQAAGVQGVTVTSVGGAGTSKLTFTGTGTSAVSVSASGSSLGIAAFGLNASGTTAATSAGTAVYSNLVSSGSFEMASTSSGSAAASNFKWKATPTGNQTISIHATDSTGASHPLSVDLTTSETSIDMAVGKINDKLQKSNDATLQQITAVAVVDQGVKKVNFVSTLNNFSVSLGSSDSGNGLTDDGGLQGTTTQALQIGSGGSADISTLAGAQAAVTAITQAVAGLGTAQASIGKSQNQLGYAINLANSQITNFSAAESQIRDANVAQQAANLSKAQTLSQASIAAMAQANSAPQAVLSLLRG